MRKGLLVRFTEHSLPPTPQAWKLSEKCHYLMDYLQYTVLEGLEEIYVEFEIGTDLIRGDFYWRGTHFESLTQKQGDPENLINNREWSPNPIWFQEYFRKRLCVFIDLHISRLRDLRTKVYPKET